MFNNILIVEQSKIHDKESYWLDNCPKICAPSKKVQKSMPTYTYETTVLQTSFRLTWLMAYKDLELCAKKSGSV